MRPDVGVAVVGAGPHGLSAGHHLRSAGVDVQVFGEPMSFWHGMPKGMTLRSNWSASNIASTSGPWTLSRYVEEAGEERIVPIPLETFQRYGHWFQRNAVPDVDLRRVTWVDRAPGGGFDLTLGDGERLIAERVVMACGIEDFAWLPEQFRDLPADLVSHTGDHPDMGAFAGKRLAIVGGGQSALGGAALAMEGGAEAVDVFVRTPSVLWLRPRDTAPITKMGRLGPVLYAPTDVGPLWYSRLVATPELFRRLPRSWQKRIEHRSIRAACSDQIRRRLGGVAVHLSSEVVHAAPCDGGVLVRLQTGAEHHVDHLIFGTGYRIDVARHAFLSPDLVAGLRRREGYPLLKHGMESSIPGLHWSGAAAAWSFGPVQRFVAGSWFGSRRLTAAISSSRPSRALVTLS